MIRVATVDDREDVLRFLKLYRSEDEVYRIDRDYNSLRFFMTVEDNIKAIYIIRSVAIKLNNRFIRVSILEDLVLSDSKYRDELLLATIDLLEHQDLITFKKGDDELYKALDFKTIYYKNIYRFDKYYFDTVSTEDIKPIEDSDELLDVYASYMKLFDGFEIRDEKFFNNFDEDLRQKKGNIFGVYKDNKLKAYFTYRIKNDVGIIDECIYLKMEDLSKIISYSLKYTPKVLLKLSSFERLERYYGDIAYKKVPYMMARVNDLDLFNKLYDKDVKDIIEAMTISDKALWFNE